jgi:hypothetical protein
MAPGTVFVIAISADGMTGISRGEVRNHARPNYCCCCCGGGGRPIFAQNPPAAGAQRFG